MRAPNLPSVSVHLGVIDDYLQKECRVGRMARPFAQPPFSPFHCSGLGVVLKQDSTWRVPVSLSNWALLEGSFEVNFGKKSATSKLWGESNSGVDCGVAESD